MKLIECYVSIFLSHLRNKVKPLREEETGFPPLCAVLLGPGAAEMVDLAQKTRLVVQYPRVTPRFLSTLQSERHQARWGSGLLLMPSGVITIPVTYASVVYI